MEKFQADDFQKAEEFVPLMHMLYISTLSVSSEKSATSGQILPILKKLKQHYTIETRDSVLTRNIKEKIWTDLSARYQVPWLIEFVVHEWWISDTHKSVPRFLNMNVSSFLKLRMKRSSPSLRRQQLWTRGSRWKWKMMMPSGTGWRPQQCRCCHKNRRGIWITVCGTIPLWCSLVP